MITTAISSRAARGLPNRLAAELAGMPVPPSPVTHALTAGLRRRAAELGRSELLSLWAGQGVLEVLVEETDDAVHRSPGPGSPADG